MVGQAFLLLMQFHFFIETNIHFQHSNKRLLYPIMTT